MNEVETPESESKGRLEIAGTGPHGVNNLARFLPQTSHYQARISWGERSEPQHTIRTLHVEMLRLALLTPTYTGCLW
jgi:hypothetical protein